MMVFMWGHMPPHHHYLCYIIFSIILKLGIYIINMNKKEHKVLDIQISRYIKYQKGVNIC